MIEIEKDYPLSKLNLSEENPRQIKKSKFAELRKSLTDLPEMTEVREIVIDENNKVLAGHQRIRAMLANGQKTATVKRLIDWTDEAKRQFMVKDNTHAGEWDSDIIANQWDIQELNDWGAKVPEVKERLYYGDEREKTFNQYHLHEIDYNELAGKWGMPIIKKCDYVPDSMISFNYVLSATEHKGAVHFFIDDYQFERLWNSPKKYMSKLALYDACLTPDFSLYLEMPLAMQIWNVYRSRMVGKIMADYGIRVIPTLQWAESNSFDFCFDGIEPGGTVAVSTIGVKRDDSASKIWYEGMAEAEKRLKPSHVLVYGGDIGYSFGSKVTYFDTNNFKDDK